METNVLNAAVSLLAMVGVKINADDVKTEFNHRDKPLWEMKPSTIRRAYNHILERHKFVLMAADNKWEDAMAPRIKKAILALVFACKPKLGTTCVNQVCIFDSSTSTLIPSNNEGTTCYVGTSIRDLAAEAYEPDNRKKIMQRLRRYLYTRPDGKPYTLDSLLAVYELCDLPPNKKKNGTNK